MKRTLLAAQVIVPATERVTLRDIALRANVSASTVSRVLNNYPFVDHTTRSAVLQAARELDYPVEAGRRAAVAAPRTVLMLTRNPLETIRMNMTLFGGTLEQLTSAGAQPILAGAGMNLRTEHTTMCPEEASQYAAEVGVLGLLLLGGIQDLEFLRRLQALQVPFVVAPAPVRGLSVNYISPDYERGMESAVEHLAHTGRRCIGLVNGPDSTATSHEKLRGYRLGLALQDLPFDPRQVTAADAFDPDDGYKATARLLEQAPDVDAIVYALDPLAFGGLRCLRGLGRRVPEDVAAVGFMDYDIARYCEPPLTTLRTDLVRIGAVAARRLVNLIERPDGDELHIHLPVEMVVRESA